jgi:hypothetical protein
MHCTLAEYRLYRTPIYGNKCRCACGASFGIFRRGLMGGLRGEEYATPGYWAGNVAQHHSLTAQ